MARDQVAAYVNLWFALWPLGVPSCVWFVRGLRASWATKLAPLPGPRALAGLGWDMFWLKASGKVVLKCTRWGDGPLARRLQHATRDKA